MAKGRKTGGRIKGVSKNKPKVVVLPPGSADAVTEAEVARLGMLLTSPNAARLPKSVMLDAMTRFEGIGLAFLERAERMLRKGTYGFDRVAEVAREGQKFIVLAVECGSKVAPYIHARLLAIESRGDMTQEQAPYVVRVPMVAADSSAWQVAVGAAIIEGEAYTVQRGGAGEALPHPGQPQPIVKPEPPAPAPVPLAADQKTGRITIMPPGPRIVQPSGTQEWLESVAQQRKAVG